MTAVVISGCPPWDGRYEFDDFSFTNRELYDIKQLSGIRAGELIEALEANDTSAYVGVALVVLRRHGHAADPDTLWKAKVGSITLDIGDEDAGEGDAVPPPTPLDGKPESESDGSGHVSESGGD